MQVHFRNADGDLDFESAALQVHDRVTLGETIFGDAFAFLQETVRQTRRRPHPEAHHPVAEHGALPRRPGAPSTRRSTPSSTSSGPTSSAAYAEQLRRVADLGCTYLQLDDTSLAYLNDPKQREIVAQQGADAEHQHEQYIRTINAAIADRPDGLHVTTHMCRGNYRSSWAAEGGYDFVAEALFSELAVDGFFLEYDDERSGGFEPLRFVPEGKQVVLGLVTTKRGELEDKDTLKRRIDEARSTSRSTSSASRRSAASPPPSRATP